MAKFKMKMLASGLIITFYEARFTNFQLNQGQWRVRFAASDHPKSMWTRMKFDKAGNGYFIYKGERHYIADFHIKMRKPANPA